jgi:N-ethylmaleimide reductase
LNDGIDKAAGIELLKTKKADAICFATLALGNPDLPERIRNNWELAKPDYSTLFAGGAKGYIDYPAHLLQAS